MMKKKKKKNDYDYHVQHLLQMEEKKYEFLRSLLAILINYSNYEEEPRETVFSVLFLFVIESIYSTISKYNW